MQKLHAIQEAKDLGVKKSIVALLESTTFYQYVGGGEGERKQDYYDLLLNLQNKKNNKKIGENLKYF